MYEKNLYTYGNGENLYMYEKNLYMVKFSKKLFFNILGTLQAKKNYKIWQIRLP